MTFNKNIYVILSVIILSLLFFSACTDPERSVPLASKTDNVSDLSLRSESSDRISLTSNTTPETQAAITPLPEEAAHFLITYFSTYYSSLASLEETSLSSFFTSHSYNGHESAALNQAALSYLISYRKMQPFDLSSDDYQIRLVLESVSAYQDPENKESTAEKLEIILCEKRMFTFSGLPTVPSHVTCITHHLVLIYDNDQWLIEQQQRFEDTDYMIREHYHRLAPSGKYIGLLSVADHDASTYLKITADTVKNNLLQMAEAQVRQTFENRQLHINNPEALPAVPATDHPYNREAAVAYAEAWVSSEKIIRNPSWFIYDALGGNCNNFVSQSIHAGGIPMDTKGYIESQWKWYDNRINSRQSEWGRSPAWTGVNEFYKYVNANSGSGMVAREANYFSGDIGDVILFTFDHRFKHAVIITEVIRDEQGHVLEYLVHSNTADQIHYPVSAYGYHETTLIKIFGWNE